MDRKDLTAASWPDYELIDSGDNRKLERYGEYVVIRPETQAIWRPAHPEAWKKAHAEFCWKEGRGSWKKKDIPETWTISVGDAKCSIRTTSFKHTGIFPEQAANWEWITARVKALGKPRVLNLFGYTGIASIVAAQAGAEVTHVDASKQSNEWSKENARLSGLPEDAIRYLTDDALKFATREVRREAQYDGIIMDPPAFGRGAKGEVWRIEEGLPELLETAQSLLSRKPGSFFLLNGYAAGYSPRSFAQAAEGFFPKAKGEYGELNTEESGSGRSIPAGIYVRFVR